MNMSKRKFFLLIISAIVVGNCSGYGYGYLSKKIELQREIKEQKALELQQQEEDEKAAQELLETQKELEAMIKEAEREALRKAELEKIEELKRQEEEKNRLEEVQKEEACNSACKIYNFNNIYINI